MNDGIEMKNLEVKKKRGRPKIDIGSASRALNYVQMISNFSNSNQGIFLYNLSS